MIRAHGTRISRCSFLGLKGGAINIDSCYTVTVRDSFIQTCGLTATTTPTVYMNSTLATYNTQVMFDNVVWEYPILGDTVYVCKTDDS